nr:MAG TPA: portal [Caudoviricetes sp.]
MLKKIINKWIEKAVAQEVANQNKSKRWEDIYDKLRLTEVDRNELLNRSIQRTAKDLKPVNAKGSAMDAANVGGSLKNVFGVSNYADDIIFTHFAQQGFIGYQACALLSQNWIINNACSVPCEDAVRPGYEINLNQDVKLDDPDMLVKIKQISEQKFRISDIARNFARNNKIFGCALALPVVDDIDYAKPFNIDGVRRGSYKGISLIEPYWITPELDVEATSAPESLHFYEPTWWRLPNGKRIHRSHVIYITGDEVPDVLKPTYYFGGLPLTQQIYERVYASERVANEAPLMALTKRMLIADGNIEAYLMNEEEAEEKLRKLSYCRDNYGVFFKRPGDNVQQIDTSLTDFDALIMTQYQLVASIARMPATKLLKTTPKGFNATGEYEMKDYIQELQHIQDNQLKPLIDRNNLLVEKSEFDVSYKLETKFNPVDMPTERELAEVRKIDADTDAILINAGAISPEESRARIIADPNSGYNGLPAEMPHSDFMEENFLDDETAAGEQLFGEQPEQTLDAWNEEDHPRADNGQFGKGGGNAKEGEKSDKTSEFLGKEFTGVKGQEAVDLLMKEKQGHVKGAFTRKDIGDIDLVWGNEDKGLCHILKRRNYPEDKKKQFLSSLSNVIEKGELSLNEKGRFEVFYDNKIAVISPDFNGDKKIKFLLTAFKQRKP